MSFLLQAKWLDPDDDIHRLVCEIFHSPVCYNHHPNDTVMFEDTKFMNDSLIFPKFLASFYHLNKVKIIFLSKVFATTLTLKKLALPC